MPLDTTITPKDAIVANLRDTVKHHINRLSSADPEAQRPYLYLVTTHFTALPGNTIEQNIDHVSTTAPKLYNHILNKTVKQHKYPSRKKYHPFMMSFIDFSGTREHQPRFAEVPHTHSILVVHPKANPRFRKLVYREFRLHTRFENTSSIREIDAVEIKPTDQDLKAVIDYSAKSYLMNFIPYVSKETQANMLILNG